MGKNTKYSEYSNNFNDSAAVKTDGDKSQKSEIEELLKDIENTLESSILNTADKKNNAGGRENKNVSDDKINKINKIEKNGNSDDDEYFPNIANTSGNISDYSDSSKYEPTGKYKIEKPDKSAKSIKTGKSDKSDKINKSGKTDKSDKSDKSDKIGENAVKSNVNRNRDFAELFDMIKNNSAYNKFTQPEESSEFDETLEGNISGTRTIKRVTKDNKDSKDKSSEREDLVNKINSKINDIDSEIQSELDYETKEAKNKGNPKDDIEIFQSLNTEHNKNYRGYSGIDEDDDAPDFMDDSDDADDDMDAVGDAEEGLRKYSRFKNVKSGGAKKSSNVFVKVSNREYTSYEQKDGILAGYQKIYSAEFKKLIAGIILFVILVYMESAPYIRLPLPGYLNINFYTRIYVLIDLQILLIIAYIHKKALFFGVKSILSAELNIYSVSAVFLALSFIHTIFTYFMRSNNPDMFLYNSITAYSLLLMSLFNIFDLNFERDGFRAVSYKRPKYALCLNDSAPMESEIFRDVIPHDTTVAGVAKTLSVSNFFSRTYKNKNYGVNIKYFIYIAIGAAVLLFVLFMGLKKDFYYALSSVIILALGSVPLCSFFVSAYPAFKAQKKSHAGGASFIGAKSIEECSDIPIISLYDRDIFPPELIKIYSYRVYGNNRVENVLQYLSAVFGTLNMPPAEIFKASVNADPEFDNDVKFVSIDDDGICYISNGRKLFVGKPDYISNMGLTVQYDPNVDEAYLKSLGSIMILASETEIMAKIYMKYELSADFHDIIKSVRKMNSCVCIRSFDPNIDNILLARLGNTKNFPVRILKLKSYSDIYKTAESTDSGLASKDSLKSFINALFIAGRTKTSIKSNILVQTVAFGISLILTMLMSIFGHGLNAGQLFLLQSFWIVIIIVLSGLTP